MRSSDMYDVQKSAEEGSPRPSASSYRDSNTRPLLGRTCLCALLCICIAIILGLSSALILHLLETQHRSPPENVQSAKLPVTARPTTKEAVPHRRHHFVLQPPPTASTPAPEVVYTVHRHPTEIPLVVTLPKPPTEKKRLRTTFPPVIGRGKEEAEVTTTTRPAVESSDVGTVVPGKESTTTTTTRAPSSESVPVQIPAPVTPTPSMPPTVDEMKDREVIPNPPSSTQARPTQVSDPETPSRGSEMSTPTTPTSETLTTTTVPSFASRVPFTTPSPKREPTQSTTYLPTTGQARESTPSTGEGVESTSTGARPRFLGAAGSGGSQQKQEKAGEQKASKPRTGLLNMLWSKVANFLTSLANGTVSVLGMIVSPKPVNCTDGQARGPEATPSGLLTSDGDNVTSSEQKSAVPATQDKAIYSAWGWDIGPLVTESEPQVSWRSQASSSSSSTTNGVRRGKTVVETVENGHGKRIITEIGPDGVPRTREENFYAPFDTSVHSEASRKALEDARRRVSEARRRIEEFQRRIGTFNPFAHVAGSYIYHPWNN